MYRPKQALATPMILLVPTYQKANGVRSAVYPTTANGIQFFGSMKTYGGTEREVNGVFIVEDTADVETWYRTEFSSGCRVVLVQSNATYEIIGEPENIEMRNQFTKFKMTRVKGGV